MEEKRRYTRLDLCTELNYEVLLMVPIKALKAQTRNISEIGLCFLADREIKPDTILYLKFNLPHPEQVNIECLGRVVWQSQINGGYLTGIEFKDLDFFKQLKIQEFITNYLKEIKQFYEKLKV